LKSSADIIPKDPVANGLIIEPRHRIILIEGIYTLLSIEPWNEAGLLLDERWFLHVDPVEAQRRLALRHVKTGITRTLEEGNLRAEQNDMPSGLLHLLWCRSLLMRLSDGRFVEENMLVPTRILESKQDPVLMSANLAT
jgi:hypothetical protein